jgi:transcriptional regulator with GAF, ATPase, and Fis domain
LDERQTFVLGRGAECQVVIADHAVSRRHAKLGFEGAWRIEDLASRNGTFVDGRLLARGEAAMLGPASVVRLASATVVQLVPPSASACRRAGRGGEPSPDEAAGVRDEFDALERLRVVEALTKCANNQSRAAQLLGISRHALIAQIERFGLQRPRKRQ